MMYIGQEEKDPARRLQGSRSRNAGKSLENYIDASCMWYRERGLAHIEKTPEPMRVLRKIPRGNNKFEACFEHKAQPDYKGTLRGGQAVVFEAKHTDGGKIERSRLTSEQMDGLETHCQLGAAAFILVSFGFKDFYNVPWEVWREMKQRFGRQYMKPQDMEAWKVPDTGGVIRFLHGIV